MAIEIVIDMPYLTQVAATRVQAAVQAALDYEQVQGNITVVFCDDDTIADLNSRFLGHEGPTDVLSFPAQPDVSGDGVQFAQPPEVFPYLGDIVIAFPFTERQATRLGRSVANEIDLLAVHGTLHLLGYDHATSDQEADMWRRQHAILGE